MTFDVLLYDFALTDLLAFVQYANFSGIKVVDKILLKTKQKTLVC